MESWKAALNWELADVDGTRAVRASTDRRGGGASRFATRSHGLGSKNQAGNRKKNAGFRQTLQKDPDLFHGGRRGWLGGFSSEPTDSSSAY